MSKHMLHSLRCPKERLSINTKTSQSILRMLAAVFGGYAFTYSLMAALVLLLPLPPADVVFFSALFPCIFYLTALLWALAAPTAQRAWRDLLGATLFAGGLAIVAGWLR